MSVVAKKQSSAAPVPQRSRTGRSKSPATIGAA